MALTVLETYKNDMLTGAPINLTTADLKVVLVTSAHAFNTAVDNRLSDISAANIVMTSDTLTGVTAVLGTLDAADGVTLNDLGNDRTSSQAFLYEDSGIGSSSVLIAHDSNVVIVSDGTNDTLNFNANGIFDL